MGKYTEEFWRDSVFDLHMELKELEEKEKQELLGKDPVYREELRRKEAAKKAFIRVSVLILLLLFLVVGLIGLSYGLYNSKENVYNYELEFNERYTQKIGTSNSFHRFKFTVKNAGIITPFFDVGDYFFSTPDGYIVSKDNPDEFIFYSRLDNANDDYIYLEPGDYEFVVGANCLLERPDEFTVGLDYSDCKPKKEREGNNSFDKGVVMVENEFYKGTLSSEEDVDIFKVELKDGHDLVIGLTSNAVLGTFTGEIKWFSGDGRRNLVSQNCFKIEVFKEDDLDTPIYETQCMGLSDEYVPVEAGTYYIRVSVADGYYDGDYVICRKTSQ